MEPQRKCDGRRPSCSLCVKRQVTCCYPDKKPSVAVEDRLERLEELIVKLLEREESRAEGASAQTPRIDGWIERSRSHRVGDSAQRPPLADPTLSPLTGRAASHNHVPAWNSDTISTQQLSPTSRNATQRFQPFHNPSSLYSLPSPPPASSNPHHISSIQHPRNASSVRSHLVENARTQRDEEEAILFMYTLNLPEAPMVSN